ncbi:glycosyltransferase family 2 protein [Kineobactrum sediminis]|uniref:glycosyltransferase family 2 protein n=1 Tax=Kineobactrum sediminis TaxID=1905677 RepID=UPI00138FDFB2|nr:glycosyltransferase [Kineobactrum sediminis]
MFLEILISTTLSRIEGAKLIAASAYNSIGIRSIVVCQTFDQINDIEDGVREYFDFGYVQFSSTQGLSQSRGLALSLSTAQYIWFLDDDIDVQFSGLLDIVDVIKSEEPDFLTAMFEDLDGNQFKNYSSKCFFHSQLTVMRVSSIEIFVKRCQFIDAGIKFDNQFGLGAKYPSGEENIFLSDALKAGLWGIFYPIVVARHPPMTSGRNFSSSFILRSKGAMFARIFGLSGFVLALPYVAKRVIRKEVPFKSVFCSLRDIFHGTFSYIKTKRTHG